MKTQRMDVAGLVGAFVAFGAASCEKPSPPPAPGAAPKAAKPSRAETPKAEAPKAETPKAETQAPRPDASTDAAKPQENANVRTLPSGIIIEDIVVGEGDPCPPGATVTIHYRGTLKDGTEFDSSHRRGQPATWPLASLIKGWQDGIPGMMKGGKRKLTIPYQMAYGEAGHPPVIPPKADLDFEIELFEFEK